MALRYKYLEGLFGWSYRYLLRHPCVIFREVYREAKSFVQRGARGYSDSDAWSIHSYLSSWLPDAIESLKRGTGYPLELCPNAMSVDGCKCPGDHKEEWNAVLTKMQDGFRASRIKENSRFRWFGEGRIKRLVDAKEREGLELFVKHYGSLWD